MNGSQFAAAVASHYTIPLYLGLSLVSFTAALCVMEQAWQIAAGVAIVVAAYPFVEFLLHRFVLHSQVLYRAKWSARLWRRLHYAHHMNPSDLTVLFGAPYTTIPTVSAIAIALSLYPAGLAGAAAALATAFLALVIYEAFHCAAHLPVQFSSPLMRVMRRHHALHHFHAETGNYGVVTAAVDRLAGTAYHSGAARPPSPTVRNLGYAGDVAEQYPWVAEAGGSLQRR